MEFYDAPIAVAFLVGAAVGAFVLWWTALRPTSRARRSAEDELGEARQRLAAAEARAEARSEAREEIEKTFKALASDALEGSSDQFLRLANERFERARSEATSDLDRRKTAIETLLAPFRESLSELNQRTRDLETARARAFTQLEARVQSLAEATDTLRTETTTLARSLKSNTARGRWGEVALRNIAELAGMTEHCDFTEQETVEGGARPDMIVRLPGDRRIAVDAKAPMDAFLRANEAQNESDRHRHLEGHVAALRGHVKTLAARQYAEAIPGDVDLVVLFLPGDSYLSAAFERQPELQVEALRSKVLLATPTTLVALLRTVAIYWQQQSLADNARNIAETAKTLYERAAVFSEHLGGVRKGLVAAVEAFNKAAGSFDRRLMPMGRQLEQMGVTEQAARRIEGQEPIDETPRATVPLPIDDGD